MLCCSIGLFLLSQLYAGLIGLRALFFGPRDDFDGLRGIGSAKGGALAFSPPRFAIAVAVGLVGLTVAYAVSDTATAQAADWMPIMTSLCRAVVR